MGLLTHMRWWHLALRLWFAMSAVVCCAGDLEVWASFAGQQLLWALSVFYWSVWLSPIALVCGACLGYRVSPTAIVSYFGCALVLSLWLGVCFMAYWYVTTPIQCASSDPDLWSAAEPLVLSHLMDVNAVPKLSGSLGPYLTGLVESDGTFFVPKGERGADGRLAYATAQIAFHSNDVPLAYHLAEVLGYGSVNPASDSDSYNLTIGSGSGLMDFMSLTNGHYRTPKLEGFMRLHEWLGHKHGGSYSLAPLPLKVAPLYSDAWLAGFVEGDGSFYISGSKPSVYAEVTQSRVDHVLADAYIPVMRSLAAFLVGSLGIRPVTQLSGLISKRITVRSGSRVGSLMLAKYLAYFPLMSSKRHDFIAWRECLALGMTGEGVTPSGLARQQALKEGRHAHKADWSHLSSFYTR